MSCASCNMCQLFKGHLSLSKMLPTNLTSRKPTRSLGRSWKIWII
uniref:Alternative protein CTNNA3 n=1 Tax=Homo sapiens TaxID=9606 RepID=L8E9K0_HUMAN|nr:alternative protein CTNNA3 [Homo sapiens]